MAQNIDLGTFQWDTNKIEHQIASNIMEMNKFAETIKKAKKEVKEQSETIEDLENRIESERRAQERLTKNLNEGRISQAKYNTEIAISNDKIDSMIHSQVQSSKIQANAIIAQNKATQSTKDLRLENNELNKLLDAGRIELSELETAYRELNKELNASKIESKNLGAEMILLEREGKKNTEEYKKLSLQFAESSKKTNELNNSIKQLDGSVGDNARNVGDYKDQIKGAFSEMTTGLSQIKNGDFTGGFATIKNGFSGITASFKELSVAFLTNPVGIILSVVAGIALGVREVVKFNEQLFEANKLTQSITQLQGDMLDRVTSKTQTLEEVLGLDRKETLESARALVTQFGISYAEALELIEDGAIRGGSANNEYLDSIKEYPVFFQKAGFSAKEFVNIINTGFNLGVYKDKLQDALKEFDLSMREQTKATRDALVNAFGATFADDILNRVDKGKTTVKDALTELTEASNKYQLTEQQQAKITADIFRGAGEDVGGFAKITDLVTIAIIKQGGELTKYQQIIKDQIDAYDELGNAKIDALKSDEILAFKKETENTLIYLKSLWYKFLIFFRQGFMGLIAVTKTFGDVLNLIPTIVSSVFGALKKDFSNIANVVKSFGNVLKDALTLNWSGLDASFSNFTNSLKNGFSNSIANAKKLKATIEDIASTNINDLKDDQKAKATAQKIVEDRRKNKTTSDGGADIKPPKATKDPKKEKIDNTAQKEAEKEAKRQLDIIREEAQQKAEIAKLELAEYISNNAEKYNNDKIFTQKRLDDQIAYFNEVKRLQQQADEDERSAKEQSIQTKIDELQSKKALNENDLNEVANLKSSIDILNREYALKDVELSKQTNDKIKTETDKFEDDKLSNQQFKRALGYQQEILDLESKNASIFDIENARIEQETYDELSAFLERNNLKRQAEQEDYDINTEIHSQRKALEDAIEAEQDENKKTQLQNKLTELNQIEQEHANKSKQINELVDKAKIDGFATVFGQAKQVFGEQTALGKASAIAETTINTYKSATAAYSAMSGIPVVGPALGIAASALAVASGLKSVSKIMGVKAERGMLIQGNSHANGGVPIRTPNGMIEAEGGEVIINKRSSKLFARELSAINQAGGGVPLYANGGMIGTQTSNLSTIQNSIIQNNIDFEILSSTIREAVKDGATIGTYRGSQTGISELSDNNNIERNSNM